MSKDTQWHFNAKVRHFLLDPSDAQLPVSFLYLPLSQPLTPQLPELGIQAPCTQLIIYGSCCLSARLLWGHSFHLTWILCAATCVMLG